MGGLTCALALAQEGFKNIDVYESASDLGFVGAGIQLAPNMARVLDRLGVWKGIEAEAVNIEETSVRGIVELPSVLIVIAWYTDIWFQWVQPTLNWHMLSCSISKTHMDTRTWLATVHHCPTDSTKAVSATRTSSSISPRPPGTSTRSALGPPSQLLPATPAKRRTASRRTCY